MPGTLRHYGSVLRREVSESGGHYDVEFSNARFLQESDAGDACLGQGHQKKFYIAFRKAHFRGDLGPRLAWNKQVCVTLLCQDPSQSPLSQLHRNLALFLHRCHFLPAPIPTRIDLRTDQNAATVAGFGTA
jgi:hypothetical protein